MNVLRVLRYSFIATIIYLLAFNVYSSGSPTSLADINIDDEEVDCSKTENKDHEDCQEE